MRYTKIMKAACLTTCISQQRLPGEHRIKKEQFMSCLPVSTHSRCCFTRRKVLRWTRQAGAVTALLNWSLNLLFIPNSASSPCFLLLASCRWFAPWLPTPLSSNPQLVHSNWDALPFLLVFPTGDFPWTGLHPLSYIVTQRMTSKESAKNNCDNTLNKTWWRRKGGSNVVGFQFLVSAVRCF